MRNVVVFDDFVGKIEKAFIWIANNIYIAFEFKVYKNIIGTTGKIWICTEY